MKPIRNQILFKPFPPEEKSLGGIFVPESARQVNNKGTIVSVGHGTKNRPMTLRPGMNAIRVKDWGEDVLVGGEVHYLMDMDSILAILN